MTLPLRYSSRLAPTAPRRGSAVLIILVLLAAMAVIVSTNSTTLHLLKQELKQIDQRQQKKFEMAPRS
jgi:type II secretory pathway component PulK